ncbi:XIAP-associated factor 1 isoform X2 [Tamandua tetradactyla]|uniref:XIAP-associated factor 1 isoform X2 n=1 Tax=Tamandua tetradactyla TaxID=48850 RepID=UPI004053CD69
MEAELSVCKNCKKSVTSAHLDLHEAHCLRFLVLCPECKEAIPKEKMEEHRGQEHGQVDCSMCQLRMQKNLLEIHEAKECRERPAKCKFCELAVRFSKLGVHEDYCGRRTERCTNCNQYIMHKELTHHRDVCRGQQAQLREERMLCDLRVRNSSSSPSKSAC